MYVTNFDAPDAYSDYSSLFSDAQVELVGNPNNIMPRISCFSKLLISIAVHLKEYM
jgi:hypothetical protein